MLKKLVIFRKIDDFAKPDLWNYSYICNQNESYTAAGERPG